MPRALRLCGLLLCALYVSRATAAGEEATGALPPPSTPESTERSVHIGGALRFDYFRSDRQLTDEEGFYGATIQGKLDATLSSWADAKIDARATRPDFSDNYDTNTELIEGYVALRGDRTRARIGKQIVAWGRADGINPTDNLTPRDYTVLLPFEDDQRIGTTALTIDRDFGEDKTLSLFTTPYFEPTKIALPTTLADFVDQSPETRLSRNQTGVRLNKASGSVDWSTSYFRGYSLLPDFHPLGISSAGKPILGLNYDTVDIIGADFATNIGRYGIRGEIAYTVTSDRSGNDPFTKNPFVYYVIGADRTFGDNLNINLQLFGRHVRNHSDPEAISNPSLRAVATLNAIVNNQQDEDSYGMTARIGKKWFNDTLKGEVLAVVNFTRSNSYLRPLLTYDATDNLSITIGADLYRGDDNTFFGSLKKNQGVFAEAKYAF